MKFLSKILVLTVFSIIIASNTKPISQRTFNVDDTRDFDYQRGTYMIVLPNNSLDIYLTNETYGGDFVTFKKSQGYDIEIVYLNEIGGTANYLKHYLDYYSCNNPMLEYVLLVGDVNGAYEIPTFTIDSYNEDDIDVTDYPYTYFDDDVYNPRFFLGRWSISGIQDFLKIKNRSIQYVRMDNIEEISHLNNALLTAGNYSTADGTEVDPSQWPVTPVWTSMWLHEELTEYGYSNIDTVFFHAGNWQEGSYNPLLSSVWSSGVGVINYRGWGDANGWHKPYFHRENVEDLNNGWKLPIVLSFVCNTGDFGNNYSGPGLDKCYGETMTTAGSITNPKGAAAMVGPSDLDTDTRFNNLMCGVMWDALLEGDATELAPALHAGKHALIDEFAGLFAPDGTVIDEFYHHVYGVLGDPSIPVYLMEPHEMNAEIESSTDLHQSFVSTTITDENGEPLSDVIGALLVNNELIGKGVSNSDGLINIDFSDLSNGSTIEFYLNKAQYFQKKIELNFIEDDGSEFNPVIETYLDVMFSLNTGESYLEAGQIFELNLDIINNSSYQIDDATISMNYGGDELENISLNPQTVSISPYNYASINSILSATVLSDISAGSTVNFEIEYNCEYANIFTNEVSLIVGSNGSSYADTDPTPPITYGYWTYDSFDIDYEEAPEYDWVEINEIGTDLNLADDTHIDDVEIGFDFTYFGETYSTMTVCSNGWASFESCPINYFWNFSIPNPMGPNAMIAPFLDDLDDNDGTEPFHVYAWKDTENGRFIVEWYDVSNGEDDQNCPDCIKETFQMILLDPAQYPTTTGDGEIIFQYKEIHDIDANGNYSTIGIESPDQNDGVEYLFNLETTLGASWPMEDGVVSDFAIKFTTDSPNSISCTVMDVNSDSIINILDIITIINFIMDVNDPSPSEACASDVNGDSIINILDIISIVNYIIS